MRLSESEARKAITVLIAQRKVTAAQVAAAIRAHSQLVSDLRSRLAALEGSVVKDGPFSMRVATRQRANRRKTARRKITAARRAAMVRQGKYLAAVRRLRAGDRAKVKATLKSKGWGAAMAEAKRLVR